MALLTKGLKKGAGKRAKGYKGGGTRLPKIRKQIQGTKHGQKKLGDIKKQGQKIDSGTKQIDSGVKRIPGKQIPGRKPAPGVKKTLPGVKKPNRADQIAKKKKIFAQKRANKLANQKKLAAQKKALAKRKKMMA